MKKREREEKTEQKRRNTVIKEQTNSGRNKKNKTECTGNPYSEERIK